MEDQLKKQFKDLISSKNWLTWAIVGGLCLAAVVLKPLLFLLAIICFARATWLAWPIVKKELEKQS